MSIFQSDKTLLLIKLTQFLLNWAPLQHEVHTIFCVAYKKEENCDWSVCFGVREPLCSRYGKNNLRCILYHQEQIPTSVSLTGL